MAALRVLIVGAGGRGRGVYGPLIRDVLSDRLQLVGIVSRTRASAEAAGEEFDVPWAITRDLESAAHRWGAGGAIVCPSSDGNASVARKIAEQGLPFLLETPPAMNLQEAEALASFVAAENIAVEVAEQNPRAAEAGFAQAVVRSGILGAVRLVACDLASYRYHATGVGRALLGRPRGRRAVALRAVFPDLPEHASTVVAGTVEAEGGRVLQLRDGEGLYLADGPWGAGGWTIYGSEGSLSRGRLRVRGEGGVIEHEVVHEIAEIDGVRFTRAVHAAGLQWSADLPDAPLDDDRRAIARCLSDWLARVDGETTPTQWSLEDAVEDLRWIEALERSARLGGAPIGL